MLILCLRFPRRFRPGTIWPGEQAMETGKPYLAWLAAIMALAIVLSADVLAQKPTPRVTVAAAEDMRLWSFGDCDRKFPYFDTEEHKECVRVVGSPEAKDARALRVCEVSHQPDENEIERCKGIYYANKEKAARDGSVSNALAVAQAAASPETMRMVKAITSAAVEEKRAVAVAAPSAPADAPAPAVATAAPESSPSMTTIGLALLGMVAVGFGAKNVMRKKQNETAQG